MLYVWKERQAQLKSYVNQYKSHRASLRALDSRAVRNLHIYSNYYMRDVITLHMRYYTAIYRLYDI